LSFKVYVILMTCVVFHSIWYFLIFHLGVNRGVLMTIFFGCIHRHVCLFVGCLLINYTFSGGDFCLFFFLKAKSAAHREYEYWVNVQHVWRCGERGSSCNCNRLTVSSGKFVVLFYKVICWSKWGLRRNLIKTKESVATVARYSIL